MTSKLLGVAGAKQSGKTSSVNFITGLELCSLNLIDSFHLDSDGNLIVPTKVGDDIVEGIWDSSQTELTWDGLVWLDQNVYPFIKTYNFADKLKRIAIEIFGLDKEKVYGTDADKNSLTDIRWEDLPHHHKMRDNAEYMGDADLAPQGFMSHREFLQELGTGIFRRIKRDCWINSTLNAVGTEDTELAIIGDVRFIDEVEAILAVGGKVIYLQRNSDDKDNHSSESELKGFSGFSHIIDNREMNIGQKNEELYQVLRAWNYLGFELKTQTSSQRENEEYSTAKVNS